MVLVHGTALTVDAQDSVAQAIAVRDGRIVAVGTDAQVMKLAGAKTRVDRSAWAGGDAGNDRHAQPLRGGGAEDLLSIGWTMRLASRKL